jgi:hypothetical protein
MAHTVFPKRMSVHQLLLLEHALRQVSKIQPASWDEMPVDLHPSFAHYMSKDVWTGCPDLLTLRVAGLMIIRDAIARTGEFSEEISMSAGAGSHMQRPDIESTFAEGT